MLPAGGPTRAGSASQSMQINSWCVTADWIELQRDTRDLRVTRNGLPKANGGVCSVCRDLLPDRCSESPFPVGKCEI